MKWAEEKKPLRAKLKAANQDEDFRSEMSISRICLETLLKSLINQLKKLLMDIKLGQFTREELDSVLKKKIESRNISCLDEISLWILGRQGNLTLYSFDYPTQRINKNSINKLSKGCFLPFLREGDLGFAKNYCSITLTVKDYSALLLNRIRPEVEKILWKNQNGCWRNRSTSSHSNHRRRSYKESRG